MIGLIYGMWMLVNCGLILAEYKTEGPLLWIFYFNAAILVGIGFYELNKEIKNEYKKK